MVDDNSAYSRRIPIILGTPTINHIVMAMRESEMSTAPQEWQYHSYKFANGFFMGMMGTTVAEGETACATNTAINPSELDERVKLREIHHPYTQHPCPL